MSQNLYTDVIEPSARRGLEMALADLRAQETVGDHRYGWKISVTSPAFQKRLGLSGPLLGPLIESRVWHDGEAPQLLGPGIYVVEVELALTLGRDVPPKSSLADCAAAITQIAPAIEMLAVDGPFDDIEVVLAKNTYHAGVIFGASMPVPQDFSTSELSFDLKIDGQVVAKLDPSQIVGEPAEVVQFTADLLAKFGERLEAGQRIICGAMNSPVRVPSPARIETVLAPLGPVSLHIDRAP